MAAGSSSNGPSDENKRPNEMKRQATNPGEPVMDSKIHGPEKVKTFILYKPSKLSPFYRLNLFSTCNLVYPTIIWFVPLHFSKYLQDLMPCLTNIRIIDDGNNKI